MMNINKDTYIACIDPILHIETSVTISLRIFIVIESHYIEQNKLS